LLLKTAEELHTAGRLAEAIPLYEQILAREPRNQRANYLMGIALYQSGKPRNSIRFLKVAADINPDALEAWRDLGIILLKLRDFEQAEAAFAQALRIAPANPQFLVNRGIALRNLGQAQQAVDCHRAALQLQPGFAEAHYHLGSALLELSRPDEALASFRRATTLKPGMAEAWQGTGQALLDGGQPSEAIVALREAARLNANSADIRRSLGLALLRAEQHAEALEAIAGALAIDPAHSGALSARGAALEQLQRNEEALIAYAEALRSDPVNVDALLGQAGLLRNMGSVDEALAAYDRAIALAPQRGDAYFGAGLAFMRKREFVAAVRSLGEAARHLPQMAAVHHQHALALQKLDRDADALAALDSAVSADRSHLESYLQKARILSQRHQWEEALTVLEAARPFDPQDKSLGQRFSDRMRICDWTRHDEDMQDIRRRLAADDGDLASFNTLAYLDDPALQRHAAEATSRDVGHQALPAIEVNASDRRITVAYVSGDYRDHATMYLMADVFEHHDRSRFRLVGLSLRRSEKSVMRARVMPFFDAFHDLDALSDDDALALTRQEGIDIAVDMMGFTRHARSGLFAARLAPVQVNYLGFAGTMGLPSIDYIVADPVLIPEGLRAHYTEKVAYLPDSYQPNDRKRLIAAGGSHRAEHGLPDEAFVFCCFNNSFKITPQVFDSWMRILAQAPGSVLWLFSYAAPVERNLRAAAEARGIDPQRLVFARSLPLPDHLARHRAADLFLDTLPYNAHTTASDALWAGLPVLTLMGETFASRVAASLLTAAGASELIAPSRAEYERMAVGFYKDRDALKALRSKIAANKLSCALFDPERYTRNLEALFAQMAKRHRDGLPPDHLFA
jgi:predicted O-linked N-acetylglucosamine transferase (SPINDLY family)